MLVAAFLFTMFALPPAQENKSKNISAMEQKNECLDAGLAFRCTVSVGWVGANRASWTTCGCEAK